MVNPQAFQKSLRAYGEWLNQQNSSSAKRWSDQVNADHEGAVAEAVAFDWLAGRVDKIEHGDPPGCNAPDFICTVCDRRFYVEVTNISVSSVERKTGLKDEQRGFTMYRPLTGAIMAEVVAKSGQFSRFQFDAPLVVFVTTLQFAASCVCVERGHIEDLLTGTTYVESDFDRERGEAVGDLRSATRLGDSLFIRQSKLIGAGLDVPRKHVSAVLIGGFGVAPPAPPVYGVLHPEPNIPFPIAVLPDVAFAYLDPWPPRGELCVRWSDCSRPEPPSVSQPRLILPSQVSFDDLDDDFIRGVLSP